MKRIPPVGLQIDYGKYIPFRLGQLQPVLLDSGSAEFSLNRHILQIALRHPFRDMMFMGIFPHRALVVIGKPTLLTNLLVLPLLSAK